MQTQPVVAMVCSDWMVGDTVTRARRRSATGACVENARGKAKPGPRRLLTSALVFPNPGRRGGCSHLVGAPLFDDACVSEVRLGVARRRMIGLGRCGGIGLRHPPDP